MAYRKAKCIELHDVNTVITTSQEGYLLSAAAGRSVQASRPAFFLRWSDVAVLARRFGLSLPGAFGRQGQNETEAEFPILRAYYETPADTPGVRILDLSCDVQSANLVEIRIVSRVEGAPAEGPDDVELITHSGAFTIWWAGEQPVDTQVMMAVAEAHPTIPVEGETLIDPLASTTITMEIPDGESG